MQRFYNYVSLSLIAGLLVAAAPLTAVEAKPASDVQLASIPNGTTAPDGTTLPGATRAIHVDNINPSTHLRSLPSGSGSSSSSRRAGATRGGQIVTAASLFCANNLVEDSAIATEQMEPTTTAAPITMSDRSEASFDLLTTAIAHSEAATWQLHVFQFSADSCQQ